MSAGCRSHTSGGNRLTNPGDINVKVTIRKDENGVLRAYVPKKDLEEPIVYIDGAQLWGGRITLANGWQFQLPELANDTTLPVTVEARRLSGGCE